MHQTMYLGAKRQSAWRPSSGALQGRHKAVHAAKRILIVEDEYFVALQIEGWLTDAGYTVVDIVRTAEDAVSTAVATKPDLLIMDIRLKGERDGIDAAAEIYLHTEIPSLFASAFVDTKTRKRGHVARPAGWLTKPFTPEEFLSAVDSALSGRKN